MADKQLDELANILYRADMKAEGDPLVYKWEALGEPWVSKYRAMARAAQAYKQQAIEALAWCLTETSHYLNRLPFQSEQERETRSTLNAHIERVLKDVPVLRHSAQQGMTQYKVALWPSALSEMSEVTEIDTVAEDAAAAAISALRTHGVNAMGVIVVMSATQQETFYDAALHTGQKALAYSRTAASPRFTDKPFIWKESEQK